MGKKSKSKGFSVTADNGRSDNYVPGWFGGLTSPAAQKSAAIWAKETLKSRILSFEAARRDASPENETPSLGR